MTCDERSQIRCEKVMTHNQQGRLELISLGYITIEALKNNHIGLMVVFVTSKLLGHINNGHFVLWRNGWENDTREKELQGKK